MINDDYKGGVIDSSLIGSKKETLIGLFFILSLMIFVVLFYIR